MHSLPLFQPFPVFYGRFCFHRCLCYSKLFQLSHGRIFGITASEGIDKVQKHSFDLRQMEADCEQKIDLTGFPSLFFPENVILHKLFERYGYELRIAGGAVRDVLLGLAPKDIDYATNATPNQMVDMFTNENVRMLNRNGESHGTVTARINDKVRG